MFSREISFISIIKRDWFFLLCIILLGCFLRLDLLVATNFSVDSDEAIVGLMGKHILEGKEIPTFYYGQHYMGSLEPLVSSALFYFGGITSKALKAAPFLFAILLFPVTYILGFLCSGKGTARLASIFLAVPSAALVEWSTKARGGFIEIVFIGTVALVLCARWLNRPTLFLTTVIGLLLGIGWWTNNQIIYTILPIGLMMLLRLLSRENSFRRGNYPLIKNFACGMGAFFVGGAPFWIYNLEHKWISFQMFHSTSKIFDNVLGFFSAAVPIIVGAKRFWHVEELFPGSVIAAYLVFGIPLLLYLATRFPQLGNILKGRLTSDNTAELLFIFLLTTSAVFVTSSFGYLFEAPRYLLPLYPPFYVLVAAGITNLKRGSTFVASVLAVSILSLHLASSFLGGRAVPGEPMVYEGDRVQSNHTELIEWLENKGYTYVKTNYWIGYKLAFETKEAIRFVMVGDPLQVRIKEYQEGHLENESHKMPLVLTDKQAELAEKGLDLSGYVYETTHLSGYSVLYNIESREKGLIQIPHTEMTVATSSKAEEARNAIDDSVLTRWGSGTAQKPGMFFNLTFAAPRTVRSLAYALGQWSTDMPRKLAVFCVKPNNEETQILSDDNDHAIRLAMSFLPEGDQIYFSPIECSSISLRQTGSDPVFDWSIAELNLYQ